MSLISSNIVILVYMSNEVNHSLSLDAIINLNYLSYSLAQSALILRSNDINRHLLRDQYYSDDDLTSILDMIDRYQSKIFDDLPNWSYCHASDVVNYRIMSYWEVRDTIDLQYADLYNFVEFIKQNVKKTNTKMKAGLEYRQEIMNVLSNALEGPFNQLLITIDDLVDCETQRIDDLEKQKTSLLMIGIAVLASSISIIAIYLKCSDHHLNALWEHLRLRSLSKVTTIRQALNERLQDYHNRVDSAYEEIEGLKLKDSSKFNFRHSLWFIFKMSALFLLTTLFLFLAIYVFYTGLRDYLYYRPLLVVAFPRRRIQLSELAFSVLESKAVESKYSLIDLYPEFTNLRPVKIGVKDKINYIKDTGKYINNKNTKKLMSSQLYDKIFKIYPNSSDFLLAGTYRAVAFMNTEALFAVFNNVDKSFEVVDIFMDRINEFNKAIAYLSGKSHTDSKNIIKDQLSSMITFIASVGSILLISYLFIYLPMLKREIRILKHIVKVLKLIPRSNENEMKKDQN